MISAISGSQNAAFTNDRTHHDYHREVLLANRITTALKLTGHPCFELLRVDISADRAVLRGQVCSYYLKQLAQETASRLVELREISNEIQVIRSSAH